MTENSLPWSKIQFGLGQYEIDVVAATLATIDPQKMTPTDANFIVQQFSNAGLTPSAALSLTMADFGFDPKKVGQLAAAHNANTTSGYLEPKPGVDELTPLINYHQELVKQTQSMTEHTILDANDKASILDQLHRHVGLTIPAPLTELNECHWVSL